jgi:uncharacterized protein (DUF1778 family)
MLIEEDYIKITLSEEDYDRFIEDLNNPPKPNDKLLALFRSQEKLEENDGNNS